MREDFLCYKNYATFFQKYREALEENVKNWIFFKKSFHQAVPLTEATDKTQRMLFIYSTGRDCAAAAIDDLDFENISCFPTIKAFVNKCSYNIAYRKEEMRKCFNSVSDIPFNSPPLIYANMLNLFNNQIGIFSAILEKLEDLKNNIDDNSLKMEPNTDKSSCIYNINSFQGILGDVKNSEVTQNFTITKGNFKELEKILIEYGLKKEDILELKDILELEPLRSKNTYGPKLSNWIEKMIGKAASGLWDVSINVAAELISRAIAMYAGF